MKKVVSILAAILVSVSLSSCFFDLDSIKGSGNVVTQDRSLPQFSNVHVESGLSLTIERGDATKVVVEADDNLQQHVQTTVENGTLYLSVDGNSFRNATMNVTVTMPTVNKIEADGGSSVNSRNTLFGNDITVVTDGGSEVKLDLESERVTAESESGSSLTLRGKALTLKASSDSGSSLDAEELIANDVVAEASSGSSASVRPAVSLKASASSGASISYSGNPQNVTVDRDSGGDVTKR